MTQFWKTPLLNFLGRGNGHFAAPAALLLWNTNEVLFFAIFLSHPKALAIVRECRNRTAPAIVQAITKHGKSFHLS